jgi:hypothetical protein
VKYDVNLTSRPGFSQALILLNELEVNRLDLSISTFTL